MTSQSAPAVSLLASRTDVLYLDDPGVMVVREHRLMDGWRCTVVATRTPRLGDGHLDVTDTDLSRATPLAEVTMDASDPDGLAVLWLAQVWFSSPGSQLYALARVLSQAIRDTGTLTVAWTTENMSRLVRGTHTYPELVLRRLARLDSNGFLHRNSTNNGSTYVLTFPPAVQSLAHVAGRYPHPEPTP